jgi:hypothetical protein
MFTPLTDEVNESVVTAGGPATLKVTVAEPVVSFDST